VPSENVTPGINANVYVRRSALIVQRSASCGTIWFASSYVTMVSKRCCS